LALDYFPFEARSGIGLYTASERARALETGTYTQDVSDDVDEFERSEAPVATPVSTPIAKAPTKAVDVKIDAPITFGSSTELLEAISGIKSDAPLCMTCGVKMRASGACYVCEGCGNTSGCS